MFGFRGSAAAPVQRVRSLLIVTLVGKTSQLRKGLARCSKFREYTPGANVHPRTPSDVTIPRGSVSFASRCGNKPRSTRTLFPSDTDESRLASYSFRTPFNR